MAGQKKIRKKLAIALAAAFVIAPVAAQAESTIEVLLEKLRAKGVISEFEYGEFKAMHAAESKEAEKQAAETLVGKFKNGFKFETADKQNSIQLEGRVQADYRHYSPGSGTTDMFDIRRARLGISGKFMGDWEYEVTGDYDATEDEDSGFDTELDTAKIAYAGFKPLKITAGKFKMPFSLEEQTSSRFIDFMERSMVNTYGGVGKNLGFMLSGEPFKGATLAVAYANTGTGVDVNASDEKETILRGTINLSEMMGSKNTIAHLGLGYTTGKFVDGDDVDTIRPDNRGEKIFDTGNFSTLDDTVDLERKGLELALAYDNFKLQGEYLTTTFSGDTAGGSFDKDLNTAYISAMWMITGEKYADSYKGGRFGGIKPKKDFKNGSGGAWELGVRYSMLDGSDFLTGNGPILNSNYTDKASAWTVGLKWIPNYNTRVMLNYVKANFDDTVTAIGSDEQDAFMLRTQVFF